METTPANRLSPLGRSSRLRINVAALVGARGLTVALGLAQVTVAIPYLGETRYGTWMLLLAVAGAVHICDFGIGLGTQRAMADALARQEPDQARSIARAGACFLGWMALVVLALGLPLVLRANWPAWCGLTASSDEARPAAIVMLVMTALALPFNMAPRLAGAAQLQWIQALWATVGSAATLGLVVLAAAARWPLLAIVAGAAGIAILQNAAMAAHAVVRLRWSAGSWTALPPVASRELRRACAFYATPQLGQALVQGMPSTALSLAGGPAAVTAYNLLQRLLNPLAQAQGLMLASLWPAYTEAHARGETEWVRRKFIESLWLTAGFVLTMILLTSQADWLIGHWTRRVVSGLEPTQAWLACIWLAALALAQPLTALLVGLGHWRQLARASAVGYPATAAGLLLGGTLWGAPAALALGSVALCLTLIPALANQCRQTLIFKPGGPS